MEAKQYLVTIQKKQKKQIKSLILFYVVHNISKSEFKKPSLRLDCKRPVSDIAIHPTEPILVINLF